MAIKGCERWGGDKVFMRKRRGEESIVVQKWQYLIVLTLEENCTSLPLALTTTPIQGCATLHSAKTESSQGASPSRYPAAASGHPTSSFTCNDDISLMIFVLYSIFISAKPLFLAEKKRMFVITEERQRHLTP